MSLNRISRRDALFVIGAAVCRANGGLLQATRVDHVSLAVGDIDKSVMFYRHLFGNEVLKDSRTPRRYLRLGPCYAAIAPAAAGEPKRIDHVGIGIENFNAPGMKSALEKAGLKVRESNVGLFVTDPDGTSVQIWRTSPGNN
jgi:catechol 2,3-dioxygenase-like lactoylglutathione lyase family enzyme